MNSEVSSIYATYVGALLHTESKRQNASQVYLTISIAIITTYSTVATFPASLAGGMVVLVGISWSLTIYVYRSLAKAKFAIIEELERQMPFDPFTREWHLSPNFHKSVGFTRLEMMAPLAMLIFAVYALTQR